MFGGGDGPKTLLVWDFDHSLIDADIDHLVFADAPGDPPVGSAAKTLVQEQEELWRATLRKNGTAAAGAAAVAGGGADGGDADDSSSAAAAKVTDWVDVMNEMFRRLAGRLPEGQTLREYVDGRIAAAFQTSVAAAAAADDDDKKAEAGAEAAAAAAEGATTTEAKKAVSPLHAKAAEMVVEGFVRGWEQAVVSQANSVLLGAALEAANLGPILGHNVHTFPASYSADDMTITVSRFHGTGPDCVAPPHTCTRKLPPKPTKEKEDGKAEERDCCAPMMCKGAILRDQLSALTDEYEHIIYVGDGTGDYCAAAALRESDAVMARAGFPLSDHLANAEEADIDIAARVIEWNNYPELFDAVNTLNDAWSAMRAIDMGILPQGFVLPGQT